MHELASALECWIAGSWSTTCCVLYAYRCALNCLYAYCMRTDAYWCVLNWLYAYWIDCMRTLCVLMRTELLVCVLNAYWIAVIDQQLVAYCNCNRNAHCGLNNAEYEDNNTEQKLHPASISYVGLARTIYIRYIYGIFGREIIKYTVIYGVYIRFWPTRLICLLNMQGTSKDARVAIVCPVVHR